MGKTLDCLIHELHRARHVTIGGLAAIRAEMAFQWVRTIEA
jgi:hypothetical protein